MNLRVFPNGYQENNAWWPWLFIDNILFNQLMDEQVAFNMTYLSSSLTMRFDLTRNINAGESSPYYMPFWRADIKVSDLSDRPYQLIGDLSKSALKYIRHKRREHEQNARRDH